MAALRPTSALSDNKHKHNRAPCLCACSTHPIGSATPVISRISNSTNTNALVAAKSKSGGMPISVIGDMAFAKKKAMATPLVSQIKSGSSSLDEKSV